MAIVKIHTCKSQEFVSQGIEEPPADRCRCRQMVSKEKAKEKVDKGEAKFVVLSRTHESVEVPCPLCQADPEVKNCANCHGTGRVEVNNVKQEVGDDIVLVSRSAVDKERKYRPALAMKTPRVATIESSHILRAYVPDRIKDIVAQAEKSGNSSGFWDNTEVGHEQGLVYNRERTTPAMARAAQDRIEEYGEMIIESRMFTGPKECRHNPEFSCERCKNGGPTVGRILAIKMEPTNNAKTGIGRDFDYGRTI